MHVIVLCSTRKNNDILPAKRSEMKTGTVLCKRGQYADEAIMLIKRQLNGHHQLDNYGLCVHEHS
jgi:hypothetical protein